MDRPKIKPAAEERCEGRGLSLNRDDAEKEFGREGNGQGGAGYQDNSRMLRNQKPGRDRAILMIHGVECVGVTSVLNIILTLLVARRAIESLTKPVPGLATWLIAAIHLMKGVPGATGSRHVVHGILARMRLGGMHLASILRGVLVLLA